MNSGQRPHWNIAEQAIIEIISPLQKFVTKTARATKNFWLNYFYLIDVREENRLLKERLEAITMENSRYREELYTLNRLQKLLQFRQKIQRPVVAAQVIGRDPTGWFKSVIIDKGENAGIKSDMPVVNAQGIVGRVVSVSPDYAKVLLIIDQNSAVDCLVQSCRDRGIVRGISSRLCELAYVDRSSDVTPKDMVITSGLGGVFPKGLPVGRVLTVKWIPGKLFKEIRIKPVVDFSRLEEVLVILKEDKS